MLAGQDIFRIQLLVPEALPAALLCPVPEEQEHLQGQIIEDVLVGIIDQEKGNPALLLEFLHEAYLMRMDVLQGKGVRRAFLCVEADGKPLYRPDVVNRTLLLEIGQRDLPALLVYPDGSDGGGHLLNQGKARIRILFVCPVDHILQCGAPQPPGT